MKYCLMMMLALSLPGCTPIYAQSLSVRYGMPLPMISVETEDRGRLGAKAGAGGFADINGKTWLAEDFKGKVLYVYCCDAASAEAPEVWGRIHYLAEKYACFNTLFLVMVADSSRKLMHFREKLPLCYVIAVNQQHWLEQLGVMEGTASVIINRKGRVSYWKDTAAAGKLADEVAVLEKLLVK